MSWQVIVERADPVISGTPNWVQIQDYVLDDVEIVYGRRTVDETVSPTSAGISLLLDSSLGTFDASSIDLGDLIRIGVKITPAGDRRTRFSGGITDISINKDSMDIVAVSSSMSRYGLFSLTAAFTSPFTTAGMLASAIANNADPSAPSFVRDLPRTNFFAVGSFNLDPDFQIGQNALEALYLTIQSEPFGFLYEEFITEGLRSTAQNSRKVKTPHFILSGDEILDDWQVQKSVTSQVTRAVVNYANGLSTGYTATTGLGEIEKTYDTIIQDLANADTYALYMVGKGQNLPYEIPSITIPIGILPTARQEELIATTDLNGLRINKYVRIPEIRSYIQTEYFVEGWTENLSRSRWNLTLNLSSVGRSRWFQAWEDVTATLKWEDVEATRKWQTLENDWI